MRCYVWLSRVVGFTVFVVCVAAVANAGQTPARWLDWERATGDWGGARTSLEKRGIELGLGLTAIWQANHRGGLQSKPEGKFTTSWDAELTLSTDRLGLWQGGTALVYLEGVKGTGIDERYVGSYFGVNGDAGDRSDHHAQFSEYWYEHTFGERLLTVRVGKIDATRDFDTNAFANDECAQFLNGALVNNPTVPFPDYALGAQATVRPCSAFYASIGAFDANAKGSTSGRDTALESDSDWFVVAEAGIESHVPCTTLPLAWRVGAWHDPCRYERIGTDELTAKGESGWYASVDHVVWRESVEAEDDQGLGIFARYGYAPDDYSEVEHFWSCGAQYQGIIPTRDDDVCGIGIAQGKLGQRTRRSTTPHDNETACECYYCLIIGGGAALTLDVQYIKHPSATERSCVVPGVRFQLDF